MGGQSPASLRRTANLGVAAIFSPKDEEHGASGVAAVADPRLPTRSWHGFDPCPTTPHGTSSSHGARLRLIRSLRKDPWIESDAPSLVTGGGALASIQNAVGPLLRTVPFLSGRTYSYARPPQTGRITSRSLFETAIVRAGTRWPARLRLRPEECSPLVYGILPDANAVAHLSVLFLHSSASAAAPPSRISGRESWPSRLPVVLAAASVASWGRHGQGLRVDAVPGGLGVDGLFAPGLAPAHRDVGARRVERVEEGNDEHRSGVEDVGTSPRCQHQQRRWHLPGSLYSQPLVQLHITPPTLGEVDLSVD